MHLIEVIIFWVLMLICVGVVIYMIMTRHSSRDHKH
jgi:hypothetical protein